MLHPWVICNYITNISFRFGVLCSSSSGRKFNSFSDNFLYREIDNQTKNFTFYIERILLIEVDTKYEKKTSAMKAKIH